MITSSSSPETSANMSNDRIACTCTCFCILIVSAAVAILLHNKTKKQERQQQLKLLPLPPMAPFTFLQIVHHLSGPDLPWFFLRISRTPNIGPIFRIQMHPLGSLFGRIITANNDNWGPTFVVTADAKLAQMILRDSANYKHPCIYGIFEKVGGRSIFSAEGARWHHARKAVSPAFHSKQIARMNEVVSCQIRQWMDNTFTPLYVKTGTPFDPSEEFLQQMLKGISLAGFDYTISEEELEMVLLELNIAFREILAQSINPLREKFSSFHAAGRRMMLSSARARKFAQSVLDHYRQRSNSMKSTIISEHHNNTIISMIANNNQYQSDVERCSDIISFYIAGHDTTAYTLAWILLELARNPAEQTRLREALRRAPVDDRIHTPELKHVIKEGMRLHPVAPNIWRTLDKNITTEDYYIPKGAHISIATLSIQRNAEYFEDPDEFRPSRWEDPNDAALSAFMPFALGRRNCVGQSLAYAELCNTLAILLADHELRVVNEGRVDFFVTLKPIGVKLIVTKVEQ